MATVTKFIDMARSPAEIKAEDGPIATMAHNTYPYGLCICLNKEELDKLNMDMEVDAGDMIQFKAMGKVTSVTKRDTDQGQDCRVEIQITAIAVDALQEEDGEEEEDMPRKVRNPYKK